MAFYFLQLNLRLQTTTTTTTVNIEPQETEVSRCRIIDDTDLHKTGRRIELIGRIFNHVTKTSILGFKGLVMAYHDGKSLFALDVAFHYEKGKNLKKPYGLKPTQAKERYSKKTSERIYFKETH